MDCLDLPKDKEEIGKNAEFSGNCHPNHFGLEIYAVESGENTYIVDIPARTYDCKRFQLSGIPCSHVITCCRADRIYPESLVHKCYNI